MFQVDVSRVASARSTVGVLRTMLQDACSVAVDANNAFLGSNNGGYADAANEAFLMLETRSGVYADGLERYEKALSDAHDALDGRVRAARDRVLAASGGSVSGRDVLSFGRTGVMSACDDAEDAATELARGAAAAKGAAEGLDALGGEREAVVAALGRLEADARGQARACSVLHDAWRDYGSAVDEFEGTYAARFPDPIVSDEAARRAIKAMNERIEGFQAGTVGSVSGFVGVGGPLKAASWFDSGSGAQNAGKKALDKLPSFLDNWVNYAEGYDGDVQTIKEKLPTLRKTLADAYSEFSPSRGLKAVQQKAEGARASGTLGKQFRKAYDDGMGDSRVQRTQMRRLAGVERGVSIGKAVGAAGKAAGVAGKIVSVGEVGAATVRTFQTAQGGTGDKLAAAGTTLVKTGSKVAVGTAATAAGSWVGSAAAAAIVVVCPALAPAAPLLIAGGQLLGAVVGGYLGDKASQAMGLSK